MSEQHPHDMLRARAESGRDVVDMWAVEVIARLTEALRAAKQEAADNADDRDAYREEARGTRPPCYLPGCDEPRVGTLSVCASHAKPEDERPSLTAPSPLVALASDIARGPMGQSLVANRVTAAGQPWQVDTAQTADNVLAVARAILGATS